MSPRPRPIPAVLAVAAAAALFLGGCSSSGGGAAAPAGATPASSSSAPAATSAADSAAIDPGSSATDASSAATDASSSSASGSKVFAEPTECASIAQKYGSVSAAILPVLQGKTGPTPFDADALVQAVTADTMGTIPAQLDPDFAAFKTAAEQLRGKDLTAAAAVFDGPELSKATTNIEKFLSDHC
jgi:hypothetical protein